MEKPRKQSTCDRKGVQSLFIPAVPQIVLNTTDSADLAITSSIPHSRSAGELAMSISSSSSGPTTPGSVILNNGPENSNSSLNLYCSPRLPRKFFGGNEGYENKEKDQIWMESSDSNFPNKLTTGSRTGSALSLASEYTARSVGLISNDSSSDSTQFSDKLEQIKQRQSLLRRYVSNPEKTQNDDSEVGVSRCTKSVNNLQECSTPCNMTDDSDSRSEDYPEVNFHNIRRQMRSKVNLKDVEDYSSNLVTIVTDELALKEGRVRAWLTDIGSQENE